MEKEKFRKELIKMHEEDDNKHALQWFLNDIFELHQEALKEQANKIFSIFDKYACIKDDKWYLELKEKFCGANKK